MSKSCVEFSNISKDFPGIKALDDVSFSVEKGEIHAILGENGAGKSTLMSILFGLYTPNEGKILINGETVQIKNPNDATKLRIGMVHQHFKLVDVFTVTENIILADKSVMLNKNKAKQTVDKLSKMYGLQIDADAKIENITVGMQQRVEILKMLYRDADILIFDEPTAVLTPYEIKEFLNIVNKLKAEGKTIILITHKLAEIKAIADRVTVLRHGKVIDTCDVKSTSTEKMAELMVGKQIVEQLDKMEIDNKKTILKVENVFISDEKKVDKVNGISFTINKGEILGLAGVDGNGQKQLVEAIAGMQQVQKGEIVFDEVDITNKSPRYIAEKGLRYIPEDRHKFGLVLDYDVAENIVLKTYYKPPFSEKGFTKYTPIHDEAGKLIEKYDIRCANGSKSLVRSMSGGNQQKIIIAREIEENPPLIIASQPTRGLDVGAISNIHKYLIDARNSGSAVFLVSYELDEILKLSDRIAVISDGKIVAIGDNTREFTDNIGIYMSGSSSQSLEAGENIEY